MFKPDEILLKKYADILVKFALNSGKGLKKGEVVICYVPDVAKPLLKELQKSILEAGGHPLLRMLPTGGFDKMMYEIASDEQLKFFPKKYKKALTDLIDHQIGILADTNLKELETVDPTKILMSMDSNKKTREWLEDKEYRGHFTWTIGLYPTKAMADETGLTLEEYWEQVIRACYLDKKDPIKEWTNILIAQEKIKAKLDSLKIESVHIEGAKIDLTIKIGKMLKWLGGSGRNIPSYELFTSPDWRGTEGYIYFNQPLYMYGNKITDIRLEFKSGKVVKATAKRGQKMLEQMISRKNADKVGEFSLTDRRFSRITKFMANTLYDENIGDTYGNSHIALGLAYREGYDGDVSKVSKAELRELGFNMSAEHKDIINTQKKTVTATLKNGRKKVIYKDGLFLV